CALLSTTTFTRSTALALSHYPHLTFFFFLTIPPPPTSPLFPYTTLFRSACQPCFQALFLDLLEFHPIHTRSPRIGADELIGVKRSEEHTSELQSLTNLVCRLLLEKKKIIVT